MVDIILLFVSWIHVLSAITWLGGALILEFVVIPSIFKSSIEKKGEIVSNIGEKFGLVAQISSGLLFLTGLYRVYASIGLNFDELIRTSWGNFLLLKVILFFVFVGLGITVGKNMQKIPSISPQELGEFLKKTKRLQHLDLAIGFLIILIAEILRYGGTIRF